MLFISHRLDEVFAICDTVTVMRDGAVVHDARIADMTPDEMVRRMVGRELSALFPKQDARSRRPGPVGPAAHARGRVLRRQLRRARRRDRRAGRARRRGAQRGGACDLRHRQGRRRPRRDRRPAAAVRQAARRDECRHRVRARGPPPAGPGDGPLDRAQHGAHPVARARSARADPRQRREPAGRRSGEHGCSSSTTGWRTPSARCRAATSRRSCSASGSRPTRSC